MHKSIKIGTRGSKLAIAQTNLVLEKLIKANPQLAGKCQIIPIQTSGDKLQDQNLADIGGKGLFIKEIEEALYSGDIDIAIHSLKDMPAYLPKGLVLSAIVEREDPSDCLVSYKYKSIEELPQNATVGSSSTRRRAQLLNFRPDLEIIPFRGNVNTRIEKLEKGIAEATILAVAGLKRLGFQDDYYRIIDHGLLLPAIGQGAICIESRSNDRKIFELVQKINHQPTKICVTAERAFLAGFDASCGTPIAALAIIAKNQLWFRGQIAKPDGSVIFKTEKYGALADAKEIGHKSAEELLSLAGSNFFS